MKIISPVLALSYLVSEASCFTPIVHKHRARARTTTTSSLKMVSTAEAATENPRKVGLAFQLDNGTRKSHSVAQNSAFVTGFFKGLSNRDSYSQLLTSLYFVYVAMEDAFDTTSETMVKTMDDGELRRVDAARKDMQFFFGNAWEERITPSKAAKKYVDRVKEVAKNQPRLLIAHQYTRYLGDLFGGQMMGGMAAKSLDLRDGNGIAFYNFDEIDDTTDFITGWYTKLNALDLSEAEKEMIVDEANLVFEFNIEILTELEGSPFQAVWTLAWKSFKEKTGLAWIRSDDQE
jgi:heme oxygenase